MRTNEQPKVPVHVVSRCHAAAHTIYGHKAARDWETRTSRQLTLCGNFHNYHA